MVAEGMGALTCRKLAPCYSVADKNKMLRSPSRESFMRIAIALVGLAFLVTAQPASAAPLLLGDHAGLTHGSSDGLVQPVHYKYKYRRYAAAVPRGCNWQCYPYLRPYQYRYWQFYYPYGGPLF